MKKRMMTQPLFGKGFTLIELMVALVILGILVAVGVPGMQALMRNNEVSSLANRLLNTLSFARSEALTRSAVIRVCASNNGTACTGDTNWSDGWIVINTSDSNSILRVEQNVSSATISGGSTINYTSRGENSGAAVTFTINRTGVSSKTVTISNVGYASM